MTAFVEECRREWKRLGVPDLLADEMASDLEADLAEAEADGVSTAEVVGESDPRRFAATWAGERGLVSEPPPKQSRRRLWIGLAVVLVLGLITGVLATVFLATTTVRTSGSPPSRVASPEVPIPHLIGMKARRAVAFLRANRFGVAVIEVAGRPKGVVVGQAPRPGAGRSMPSGSTVVLRVVARG